MIHGDQRGIQKIEPSGIRRLEMVGTVLGQEENIEEVAVEMIEFVEN